MSLLKNFAMVGTGTATSRVLGFVRDMLIAAALGAGPVAEAFFVAQRLPNLFRRLFAEGAFSSAFVPLFTKAHQGEGPEAATRFAEEALAALASALLVVTVVAEVAMAWLTFALAPGFADDPAKFDMTVVFSRIAFPYLFLISLATLLSGALYGLGRFAAAAFSTTLLNVVMIIALVYVYFSGDIGTERAGVLLTLAITLGGVVQLTFLSIACRRAGIYLRLRLPRLTPGLRQLLRLGGPSVIAGGIVQINVVVGTIVASLAPGVVSWLYYADRLYQLPLGIVGVAVGIVLLPDLSRAVRLGDAAAANYAQNRSIEFAVAMTLPAAIALLLIPDALVSVLFEHGAFTAADTAATAPALRAYALGLPAFVAIKVLQPAYFAREDTKTPMWYAAVSMVINVVGSVALFYPFGAVGIAAALSISAWVNTLLLAGTLFRRRQLSADGNLRRRVPLLALCALMMGVVVYGLSVVLGPFLHGQPLALEVASLTLLIAAGLAFFALTVQLSGAVDIRRVVRSVLRRA